MMRTFILYNTDYLLQFTAENYVRINNTYKHPFSATTSRNTVDNLPSEKSASNSSNLIVIVLTLLAILILIILIIFCVISVRRRHNFKKQGNSFSNMQFLSIKPPCLCLLNVYSQSKRTFPSLLLLSLNCFHFTSK